MSADENARRETAPGSSSRYPSLVSDARRVLVCVDVPDRKAAVTAAVEARGYDADVATSAVDAMERLRKNPYGIVVLDEEFQGSTEHDNAVLKAIHAMPMSIRRYLFVTLIGRRLGTLDNMMAFARSVNLVVHVSDLSELATILSRAVEDNDNFYRVYRDVLREAGKR